MGLFDTIIFGCPKCGHVIEKQTKYGDCELKQISSKKVPVDIADQILEEKNFLTCDSCKSIWEIYEDTTPITTKRLLLK